MKRLAIAAIIVAAMFAIYELLFLFPWKAHFRWLR